MRFLLLLAFIGAALVRFSIRWTHSNFLNNSFIVLRICYYNALYYKLRHPIALYLQSEEIGSTDPIELI